MTDTRVVISGVGVLSALGDSLDALHQALCAGCCGLEPVAWDELPALPRLLAGKPRFDPRRYLGDGNLRPLDHTSRLAVAAAGLALESAGLNPEAVREREVGLVLGTMFGSVRTIAGFDRRAQEVGPNYAKPMEFANSVINAAAGQTAIWHDLRGLNATISGGLVSGVQALAYGGDLIRTGQSEILLAGGADELCFETFYGFLQGGLLFEPRDGESRPPAPFDARRRGLALAEAAAFLVLESAASAESRGASVLAELRGYGDAQDVSRGRDEKRSATALARAVEFALARSGRTPEELVCVSASANGDPRRDRAEAAGLASAMGATATGVPITAVKSLLGEPLGGGGVLQAATLIEAMRRGVLPGIAGLAELDDDFPLGGAAPDNRTVKAGCGLVTALGLEGKSCALVLEVGGPAGGG